MRVLELALCATLATACATPAAHARGVAAGNRAARSTIAAQSSRLPAPAPAEGEAPPNAVRLAGLRGLDVETRVEFAQPGSPIHRRSLTLGFPARGRWVLTQDKVPGAGETLMRNLVTRSGDRAFGWRSGEEQSRDLADEEREQALVHFDLLQAALVWPEGADWKASGPGRATAPASADSTLVAELGPDGRPTSIEVHDRAGQPREALRELRWERGARDRQWPTSWAFHAGGDLVWRETVRHLDPAAFYLDRFFLPPDRRPPVEREELRASEPRRVPLPPARVVPLAFDAPRPLEEARAAVLAREAELSEGGVAVARAAGYELEADGLVSGAWVVLGDAGSERVAGSRLLPPRLGVALDLRSPRSLDAALARLRAGARETDEVPGLAYLSEQRGEQRSRWRLVLTLATERPAPDPQPPNR